MKEKFALVALFVVLAGCASAGHAANESSVVLEGTLISDFERSEFHSCNGVVYWVANTGPAYELSAKAAQQNRALRISATISPEGEYGHLGRYTQEIVIKFAEIGARTPDCGYP